MSSKNINSKQNFLTVFAPTMIMAAAFMFLFVIWVSIASVLLTGNAFIYTYRISEKTDKNNKDDYAEIQNGADKRESQITSKESKKGSTDIGRPLTNNANTINMDTNDKRQINDKLIPLSEWALGKANKGDSGATIQAKHYFTEREIYLLVIAAILGILIMMFYDIHRNERDILLQDSVLRRLEKFLSLKRPIATDTVKSNKGESPKKI